jgi:hypothetical protein
VFTKVIYLPLPKDLSAPEDGDNIFLKNIGSYLQNCIPEGHNLH